MVHNITPTDNNTQTNPNFYIPHKNIYKSLQFEKVFSHTKNTYNITLLG